MNSATLSIIIGGVILILFILWVRNEAEKIRSESGNK